MNERFLPTCTFGEWETFVRPLEKFEELMNHCASLWLETLRRITDDEFP